MSGLPWWLYLMTGLIVGSYVGALVAYNRAYRHGLNDGAAHRGRRWIAR